MQNPTTIEPKAIQVDVKITLGATFVGDLLVTAFDSAYGGCWYWSKPYYRGIEPALPEAYDLDNYEGCVVTDPDHNFWTGVRVSLKEPIGDSTLDNLLSPFFTVDAATVQTGINRILSGETRIRTDLMDQIFRAVVGRDADIDADATDCIVQAGTFGKVIYG